MLNDTTTKCFSKVIDRYTQTSFTCRKATRIASSCPYLYSWTIAYQLVRKAIHLSAQPTVWHWCIGRVHKLFFSLVLFDLFRRFDPNSPESIAQQALARLVGVRQSIRCWHSWGEGHKIDGYCTEKSTFVYGDGMWLYADSTKGFKRAT